MNMLTVPHTNGSTKGMQKTWLKSTVEEFFSSVNWDDRPLEVIAPKSLVKDVSSSSVPTPQISSHPTLSLSMSVNDFFDQFPWEGQPVIAAPLPVNEEPPEDNDDANDITLDDFSGLF